MKTPLFVLMAAAIISLSGCINLKDAKTLTLHVDPDKPKPTVVTSKATIKCQDYLIIWKCNIETTLNEER